MRNDLDPVETSEWREAFDSVLEFDGADRAGFLLEELIARPGATARRCRTRRTRPT